MVSFQDGGHRPISVRINTYESPQHRAWTGLATNSDWSPGQRDAIRIQSLCMNTLVAQPMDGSTEPVSSAVEVIDLCHTYPPIKKSARRRGGVSQRTGHDGAHDASAASGTSRVSGTTGVEGPALDGVSLEVKAGEVFAVLGPNGGGKTTLFRVLSTLLKPTGGGSARVFGLDVLGQPHEVRRLLGVVFQMPSLDVKLTARENLMHHGHLYGLRGVMLRKHSELMLTQVGLGDRAGQYVETFSGGMRRRVELAKSLLHEPRLLLLDEPSAGLDPVARRDVWAYVRRLREEKGVTVVFTTHLLDEADRSDRVAILSRGKVVAVDTPGSLKARIGGDVLTVEPEGDAQGLCGLIREKLGPWPGETGPQVVDGVVRFEKERGAEHVGQVVAAAPGPIRKITVSQPSLEDVFMHLTGQAIEVAQ